MKMKLVIYDLDIKYLPRNVMFIADMLFRNYLIEVEKYEKDNIIGVILNIEILML